MKSEHNEGILKLFSDAQRSELEYRRNRKHHIFGWTASILLAIIAALFIKSPTIEKLFQAQNIPWRILVSIIVIGLTVYSICWQNYHNAMAAKHKQMLVSIWDNLQLFNYNFSISSEDLRTWGTKYVLLIEQLTYPSQILATAFLGIVGLIAIWIDSIFKMN